MFRRVRAHYRHQHAPNIIENVSQTRRLEDSRLRADPGKSARASHGAVADSAYVAQFLG
jgi:hypothetical protein